MSVPSAMIETREKTCVRDGKRVCMRRAAFLVSAPPVDAIPPDDFQPFIEGDLGPFAATPPVCVEESRIFGGGH